MTTGAFTLVYVVGTAAACRLLPRGTWVRRGAALSFLATLTLLVLTGPQLLVPGLVALGALLWSRRAPARAAAARG
jgi:amino acid efflux transporter